MNASQYYVRRTLPVLLSTAFVRNSSAVNVVAVEVRRYCSAVLTEIGMGGVLVIFTNIRLHGNCVNESIESTHRKAERRTSSTFLSHLTA